jgi:hypothetical protein
MNIKMETKNNEHRRDPIPLSFTHKKIYRAGQNS